MSQPYKRKLIETSIPLEIINRESAREKSIRHGHPSTLHLWWARRPLAAARAVLFAQLVDDPSSRPEEFRTEEAQKIERERLHDLIARLVVWENVRDERLMAEAHAEILKSTDGNPPAILDPFAGGGTIPLEAQRLGLEAHASDLNPVAVLINKALIEIAPKFRDREPVYPGLADSQIRSWTGSEGLAADVRSYGAWMRDEAEKRIGHLYPKIEGNVVVAWIWARSILCPNPACGIEMPLTRSWWLGKKRGKESFVVPHVVPDNSHASGRRVEFSIHHDIELAPKPGSDGTVGRVGATCVACSGPVSLAHIKSEGREGKIGRMLMAIAAEGDRRRLYYPPTATHDKLGRTDPEADVPDQELPQQALGFRIRAYGMTRWSDLFTSRQLAAMAVMSELVGDARRRVLADAAGSREDAEAYSDAIAVYLGLGVSRYSNFMNALCQWRPDPGKEQVGHLFARQAIPMVWDFAESNLFSNSAGGWTPAFQFVPKAIEYLPRGEPGEVDQADASTRSYERYLLSTDPPYYDNIGYSDLSDFFYIWLRQSLSEVLPESFQTLLVPKTEELVANPFRHAGSEGAKTFFEQGFREVFRRARSSASADFPITVYYAFKQSESSDDGASSSGWETLLDGMVQSGWQVTATWPIRSELGNRMRAVASNALASSIVLALRPRDADAQIIDRRGFIDGLQNEMRSALDDLQIGGIAPVDLPQAAIGPGMAVFSRYASVLETDGSIMSVRSALRRINEVLDQVLNEQEGDFDSTTRFAIAWFKQHAYRSGRFGDADSLARARNTAVATLDRDEVLRSRAGDVTLIAPDDLRDDYDVVTDDHTSVWEVTHHLIRILDTDGVGAAGAFLALAGPRPDVEVDLVPELGHLLFRVCEDRGWTKEAISFNGLVSIWPEIIEASRVVAPQNRQATLDYDDEA